MADSSPLASLLNRASHVFSLAGQLGESFHERAELRASLFDPSAWEATTPTFYAFCAALLDLRGAMQAPPPGFAPVAQTLLEAARIAGNIRAKVRSDDDLEAERGRWNGYSFGQSLGVRNPGPPAFTAYHEFSGRLRDVCDSGREEVAKARRLDDLLASVDQPATGKDAGIDTTPTLPKPPAGLIEAAARVIPNILANVRPRHDKTIELIASHLAKRLQDVEHTLAAAQWAIHESIQTGQLRAGRVEVGLPGVGTPGPGGMVWHGGGWGTIAIPKGMPAPFDAFKVVATELLWTWWRSMDAAESSKDESPANQREAGPALEPTPAELTAAKPTDRPSIALLRVFTNGLTDARFREASRLLADDALTANEKLTKIDALIRFPATASAEQLGDLLGVTKQAILKTDWWIRNRKGEKDNEIGRCRAGYQKRAKEHEKPDARNDG